MSLKMQTPISPEEQYKILSNGIVDLINEDEFLSKLKQNRPLKIKAGFDPSKPDIHLGHAVLINKLREFQELGHEVFFIVGDFTACVGDPSGQNKTRPVLSFEEAKINAKTYVEQVTSQNFQTTQSLSEEAKGLFSFFKRLDPKKTKCVFNSKWLDKISLRDFLISISSKFTVARQLERNDFSLRYKAQKPIGLHELFYPILQAYDSVELKADIEIGGTDQLFNLLLGRDLQEQFGQNPQVVLTLPLLEGLDGSQKMSKSLNNAISFNDSPKDVYGKIMKISDELLIRWWHIFTKGKQDLKKIIQEKELNPKKKKEELAWVLVCSFYGEETAHQAQEEFSKVVVHGEIPDLKNIPYPKEGLEEKDLEREMGVCELIKKVELCSSNSEARRGVLSGAIKRDGNKLTDPQAKIDLSKQENQEFILSFGKRKFKRVNLKWKKVHELKAYLIYRKVKEGDGEKNRLCEELAEDKDFTEAGISLSSIKMKFENNRFLDTGEGLEYCSRLNKEIFDKYKTCSIEKLEEIIKKGVKRCERLFFNK